MSPRAARVCVSTKPYEVGDAAKRSNHDERPVNTRRFNIAEYPRRGDRCGDTLHGSIPTDRRLRDTDLSLKKGSYMVN